jgi:hypothetical protein
MIQNFKMCHVSTSKFRCANSGQNNEEKYEDLIRPESRLQTRNQLAFLNKIPPNYIDKAQKIERYMQSIPLSQK